MIKSDIENMSESNSSQTVLVHLQYPEKEEDEIDFFGIWQQLAARKSLIFSITAFSAIVSIISVLTMSETWQSKIQFMPPELKKVHGLNVQGLNIQRLNVHVLNTQEFKAQEFNEAQYTPDSVYKKFLTNYQSVSQKRKFFNQNNLINYYQGKPSEDKNIYARQIEKAFKKFNNSLKLNLPKKKAGVVDELIFVTSTLDFSDQKASSQLLNQYAQMIKKDTLNNLLQGITAQLKQKKTIIKEQILSKKKIVEQIRGNRIVVLHEAIQTAKLLNLDEAKSQIITGTGSNNSGNKNIPLYLQGYKSLEAEKKVLEERTDDTPFINGLTELQYQNFQLNEKINRLSNEKEKFLVAKIDQEAIMPEYPIKPKRKLIVIISTILGFILSLFVVFVLKTKFND